MLFEVWTQVGPRNHVSDPDCSVCISYLSVLFGFRLILTTELLLVAGHCRLFVCQSLTQSHSSIRTRGKFPKFVVRMVWYTDHSVWLAFFRPVVSSSGLYTGSDKVTLVWSVGRKLQWCDADEESGQTGVPEPGLIQSLSVRPRLSSLGLCTPCVVSRSVRVL